MNAELRTALHSSAVTWVSCFYVTAIPVLPWEWTSDLVYTILLFALYGAWCMHFMQKLQKPEGTSMLLRIKTHVAYLAFALGIFTTLLYGWIKLA